MQCLHRVDPTRATVQRANLDGSGMLTYATRIRNAIALTTNPMTGTVWAGVQGKIIFRSVIRTSIWTA